MSLTDSEQANLRFDFTSAAFAEQPFSVIELEGVEALSRPFRFTLTLVARDPDIDFRTVLDHPATLRIFAPDGRSATPYHGMLAEFQQLHQADGYVFYQAVLVPRLWRLSLWRISEVYLHEQSIPEIVANVLKDGGLHQGQDVEQKLIDHYRARSFVCQYQESHLDFISRWMEKEGIYYYFDHDGTADKMVIVDDKLMQPADALKVTYLPDDRHDSGLVPDAVQSFASRYRPLPREVVLRDFNYRKAAVELKCRHEVSADGVGEVMYHGENFHDEAEGQHYAKLRAQEILCGGAVFSGKATAVGLRAGYFMELHGHFRAPFNARYLVTEIHHRGSQAGALLASVDDGRGGKQAEIAYRCSFRAIPADVQFRPERATPKPRIGGTLNATIDAEGNGRYAELDEYGQYKVQLPFDRTDKPADKGSARVRMASPYAGAKNGMHFPLHKGAEVLLSFADGDPDAPVIIGAVSNTENPNLVTSANSSQSLIQTHGGNRLQMEDSQDHQSVSISTPHADSFIRIGAAAGAGASGEAGSPAQAAQATAHSAAGDGTGDGIKLSTAQNVVVLAGAVSQGNSAPLDGSGNFDTSLDGSYSLEAGNPGTAQANASANYTANIAGTWSTTAGGNYTLKVDGASTVSIGGESHTTILGAHYWTNLQDTKQVFVGSCLNLYGGDNDAMYLGQRGQLMAGVNTIANIGIFTQQNLAIVLETTLAARIILQAGIKSETGTLQNKSIGTMLSNVGTSITDSILGMMGAQMFIIV